MLVKLLPRFFFLLLSVIVSLHLSAQCGESPSGENIYDGNGNDDPLFLNSQSDLDAFLTNEGERYTKITVPLVIDGGFSDRITSLCALASLREAAEVMVKNIRSSALETVAFPALESVYSLEFGNVDLGNDNTTLLLPNLTRVATNLTFLNNSFLEQINLPSLEYVGTDDDRGEIMFRHNDLVEEITIPKLRNLTGNFVLNGAHRNLRSLSVDGHGGEVIVTGNIELRLTSFGVNEDIDVALDFSGVSQVNNFTSRVHYEENSIYADVLTHINLAGLQTMQGTLYTVNGSSLHIGNGRVDGTVRIFDFVNNASSFTSGAMKIAGNLEISSGSKEILINSDVISIGGTVGILGEGQERVAPPSVFQNCAKSVPISTSWNWAPVLTLAH